MDIPAAPPIPPSSPPQAGVAAAPTSPTAPISPSHKESHVPLWIVWSIVAFLLSVGLAIGVIVALRLSSPDELLIRNQLIAEGSVHVDTLRITSRKGGFLVVFRLINPDLYSNAVARSTYLFPDTYTDFAFPINAEIDPRSLGGSLFMGVLYEDTDENFLWEPEFDRVVKTIFLKPVKSLFRDLTPPEEEPQPTT